MTFKFLVLVMTLVIAGHVQAAGNADTPTESDSRKNVHAPVPAKTVSNEAAAGVAAANRAIEERTPASESSLYVLLLAGVAAMGFVARRLSKAE